MPTKNTTSHHSCEGRNPAETATHHRTDLPEAGSPHSRGWQTSLSSHFWSLFPRNYSLLSHLGFTLVELIVVITILVILGTIAFTSLGGYSGSARDSSRVSDLANLSKSLDIASVKTGTYPLPDNAFSVTYSGWVLWNQWTVWDTVMNTLSAGGAKMNKKPTDPLTITKEYTYSTLAFGNAYQIKTDYEGESVAYKGIGNRGQGIELSSSFSLHLGGRTREGDSGGLDNSAPIPPAPFLKGELSFIPQAQAASGNPTLTYIKGNYNGIAAKTQTGNLVYILAVPSLFVNSSTGTVILPTASATGFYLHGQTNSWGITFTTKLVFSSGSLPATDSERILFASGIANAYSGTSLATNTSIASYISALTNNNTGTLASLGGSFVAANLGGTASVANSTPTITSTTFSLSATSVTVGTSVTITDTCTTHPTSYTSSNTSIATISTTTITTLTAGTTTITPVGGNCTDSAGKVLTVTAAPIPDWTAIDTNCTKTNITVGSQVWAGCNSTVGSSAITYNNGACYDYNGTDVGGSNCYGNTTQEKWTGISSSAVGYSGAISGISSNIYGALYQWDILNTNTCFGTGVTNAACPCKNGYHIPTQAEWDTLETTLGCSGTDKLTGDTTGWECMTNTTDTTNGLGWTSSNPNSLKNRLGFTLAGYCNGGACYLRGGYANYWSSSVYAPSNAWSRDMNYSNASVNRINNAQSYSFSVRCTKD